MEYTSLYMKTYTTKNANIGHCHKCVEVIEFLDDQMLIL